MANTDYSIFLCKIVIYLKYTDTERFKYIFPNKEQITGLGISSVIDCSLRMGKAWVQSLAPPRRKNKTEQNRREKEVTQEATCNFKKHKEHNTYMCTLNI